MNHFFAILIAIVLFNATNLLAQNNPSPYIGTNLARGTELRVLRLAVSCQGEFTQSVPGANDAEKVNEVLKQMKSWLQEINLMYGREYCVYFELIPDALLRKLIFTNPKTDPWPSMSGGGCDGAEKIHDIQAKVIDKLIGAANYDISQVILGGDYNGGCASWFKGSYSAHFDIGITRHEMGHQFQQGHTVNEPDNHNYEPENAGRSVQGGNSDPYAHSASYHQLALHLLDGEKNAGKNIVTGNHIPTVNAGLDAAIPIGTAFTLTGVAKDADAGDTITYVWDQLDMGRPKDLPNPNDLEGALFSRFLPTRQPSRTFPKMEDVINKKFSTETEQIPMRPRDLNFRLTVNDNHQFNYKGTMVNASGINSDDIKITVVNKGGAFTVTSQAKAENYTSGSTQTVTWAVSGTNLPPINTQNVKISLSYDGGKSFPIVLLNSTPNNGKAQVVLPKGNTKWGRIKVEAINNYFFAINSQNFVINDNLSPVPPPENLNAPKKPIYFQTGPGKFSLYMDGTLRHITNEACFFSMYSSMEAVPKTTYDDPKKLPYKEGTPLKGCGLYMEPSGAVYLLDGNVYRHITSEAVMAYYSFDWNKIKKVTSLDKPKGAPIHKPLTHD